jgi:hypothetical protein
MSSDERLRWRVRRALARFAARTAVRTAVVAVRTAEQLTFEEFDAKDSALVDLAVTTKERAEELNR